MSDDRALLCHGPARPGNNNIADSGAEDSFDSCIISNTGKRLQGSNGGLQLKDSSLRVTMLASGLPALTRQQGRHQHCSQRLPCGYTSPQGSTRSVVQAVSVSFRLLACRSLPTYRYHKIRRKSPLYRALPSGSMRLFVSQKSRLVIATDLYR